MKKSKPLTSEAQALRYAVWLLSRRPYSSGELEEKFRHRTLPPEMGKKVLERLKEKRYVDDRDFAELLVRSKTAQNWGPAKIRAALYKRRVPRELGERALSKSFPAALEKTNARELLTRQKRRFSAKNDPKAARARQKAFGFLVRKGYSLEAARLAVMEVFGYNSELPNSD